MTLRVDSIPYNYTPTCNPSLSSTVPFGESTWGSMSSSSSSSSSSTTGNVDEIAKEKKKEEKKKAATSTKSSKKIGSVSETFSDVEGLTAEHDRAIKEAYAKMQEAKAAKGVQTETSSSASSDSEEQESAGVGFAESATTDITSLSTVAMIPNKWAYPVTDRVGNFFTYPVRKPCSMIGETRFGEAVANNRFVSGTTKAFNYGTNSANALAEATAKPEATPTAENSNPRRLNRGNGPSGKINKNKKKKIKRGKRGGQNRTKVSKPSSTGASQPVQSTPVESTPAQKPVQSTPVESTPAQKPNQQPQNLKYHQRVKADMKMSNVVANAKNAGPKTQWTINKASSATKWMNRAGGVVVAAGTVVDDWDNISLACKKGSTMDAFKQAGQTTIKAAGAGFGFWGGAKIGAAAGAKIGCAIGSIFPGAGNAIGTAIGGFLGGLIGGCVGSWAGKKAGEAIAGEDVADRIRREEEEKQKKQYGQLEQINELAEYIKTNGADGFDPKVMEALTLINNSLATKVSNEN